MQRNDLYYKKFTNDPFTGEISGIENGSFKNGIKNGEWLIYHENGQLRSKENYTDGVWDGLREYYDKSGQLFYKGHFKSNRRDGIWESYYEDGQLEFKGNYKDGERIDELQEQCFRIECFGTE